MDVHASFHVGKVVKYLTIADLTLWAGWGLLDPIFSVFILERIAGATLATAGISWALYWILRAVLQIPIATYLDKVPGEGDDFRALLAGLFILAASSLGYLAVRSAWELYALQGFRALGFSLYIPAWYAIFSRHLDRGRTSFDWALDSVAAGLAAGAAAFVGGWVADLWGFQWLFAACGLLSAAAAAALLLAPSLLLPPEAADRGSAAPPRRGPLS